MKIDVVMPTRGEPTLKYSLNAIKRSVQVNNLILVAPSAPRIQVLLHELAPNSTIVAFDERNIGKARGLGLERVSTEYHASIDSDIIVSRKWYDWASDTILQDGVGACEGFPRDAAEIYGKFVVDHIKSRNYSFCSLSNTMLNTSVVRRVGMPSLESGEDWELRRRIEKAGYKWVARFDSLQSVHLRTDLDIMRRRYRYGQMKNAKLLNFASRLMYFLIQGLYLYSFDEWAYAVILELCSIVGCAKRSFDHLARQV